jgi:hypothetical protein
MQVTDSKVIKFVKRLYAQATEILIEVFSEGLHIETACNDALPQGADEAEVQGILRNVGTYA